MTSPSWGGRRSSNSSASEEDLSGDNGTIKRRPPNSNAHHLGVSSSDSSGASGTIGNNSTASGNNTTLNNTSSSLNSSSNKSTANNNASASLNSSSSYTNAMDYDNVDNYALTPSPRRNQPAYGQSISHDSGVRARVTPRSTEHQDVSDLGMRLNLIGVSTPQKPEPWSPTDMSGPNFDSSLTPVNLEIKEPITPTSSGIGTASNDSLDRTKVSITSFVLLRFFIAKW